jgi:hypothetical protein
MMNYAKVSIIAGIKKLPVQFERKFLVMPG